MKKLILPLLVLIAGGVAVGYYMWNKPPATVDRKTPDYTLDSQTLYADFQKNEDTANARYLGKVIQVTGVIQEIVPGEDLRMQVILETGDIMSRINCVMEETHAQFLQRNLKKGDTVTIKGFCTGMLDDVIIDRCIVVTG